jgi:hypothetical protein
MSEGQFVAFLTIVFENLARVSLNGAIHFHCMDWRHMREMLKAGHAVYSELKNLCVWTKDNGGPHLAAPRGAFIEAARNMWSRAHARVPHGQGPDHPDGVRGPHPSCPNSTSSRSAGS